MPSACLGLIGGAASLFMAGTSLASDPVIAPMPGIAWQGTDLASCMFGIGRQASTFLKPVVLGFHQARFARPASWLPGGPFCLLEPSRRHRVVIGGPRQPDLVVKRTGRLQALANEKAVELLSHPARSVLGLGSKWQNRHDPTKPA